MSKIETGGQGLLRAQAGHCPGCNADGLIPGPRGGASQNFYCTTCDEGWNFHGVDYGVVGVEAIGSNVPALVAIYRARQHGMGGTRQ